MSCVCPSFTVSLSPALQGVRLGDSVTGTVLPKPSHALRVEAGCSVPSPCDSNPCPANSICKDEWQSYSCVCQPGRTCSTLPLLCSSCLLIFSSPPVTPSWPVTALLSMPWASHIPVRHSSIFLEGRIPPEPPEFTPQYSSTSQGEGICFTWCSVSTLQGTTEGTVWMCVTSTPARTSRCVAASQAHPWATCVSAVGTSLGSTASTGEIQGRTMAFVPGSMLASHPGYVTRDLSVPPASFELLSSWTGGRTRPGEFGCCNIKGISLPRMDQQCPKGWWGNPTCGPCNCDVNKGFDPDCNKTNGQCHCKVRGSCARGDMDHGLPETLLILDAVPCPLQRPGSCPGPALCAQFWAGSLLSSSVQLSFPSMVVMGAVGCLQIRRALTFSGSRGSPASPGCCPSELSDDCPHLLPGLPLPPQRQ